MRLRAVAVAILVLGAGLRLWALGRQGLWYDEAVTAHLLDGSVGRLLARLPHSESTPPLYYLVAWGWVRAFGMSEAGLRSLSAVAGTLTVPVACAAGQALVGRRAGLAAAALVAVNPLLIWYSQEARSYALLVLLTALSLWAFARRRLAWWAAAAVAALLTHYFALFVILPQAVLLLAERRRRLAHRVLACAAVALTGCGLLALALTQDQRRYWFVDRPLPFRAEQVVRQLLVGFTPPAGAMVAVLAGVIALGAGLVALRRPGRRGAALAAAVAASAVGLPLLLAVAGADYVNTRNVIAAIVPLAVVVGAGLSAHRAGVVALAVLLGLSVSVVVGLHGDALAQRPPWNQVAAALRPGPGRHAIRLDGSRSWARPLNWYLPRTWWIRARGARVAEIDVVRRIPTAADCHGSTWWGAECDVGARPALTRPPARGFRLARRQAVAGFEIARYVSPAPRWIPAGRKLLLRRSRVRPAP